MKTEFEPSQVPVVVLRGGPSAERPVSLVSGAAVATALRQAGFPVLEGDIGPDDLAVLETPEAHAGVVFPVLHGSFGEDGQLQALLEQRHLRYVGSDAAASRLAMDKHAAKVACSQAGLATARARLIQARFAGSGRDVVERLTAEAVETTGWPCVIKPNAQGSSIGIYIVDDLPAATVAVADNLAQYGDCLLEQFIDGRELTVGILAGRALPVVEVCTHRRFYDYQAKYDDEATRYEFDVDLPADELAELQEAACRAFAALGCRDMARVDFRRTASGLSFLLEVNTIPGFTDHSLLPKAAARRGIPLPEMCRQIVQMAWCRPI